MELVVYLKNDSDLEVLAPLLTRMKLRFDARNGQKKQSKKAEIVLPKLTPLQKLEEARAKLLQLHIDGVDASYFGDPLEWQRETRRDKQLPFRED
jgi:hypothetical protein